MRLGGCAMQDFCMDCEIRSIWGACAGCGKKNDFWVFFSGAVGIACSDMSKPAHIDIDYVANLARIELSDEEKAKLGGQLDDILGHFEKLNAVDVDGVEPMAHAQRVNNVWREGDLAGATYDRELLEQMAPEQRDHQVVVPKVVE